MGIVSEAAFVKAWVEAGKKYSPTKNRYEQPVIFQQTDYVVRALRQREFPAFQRANAPKFDRDSALQVFGLIKDYVKRYGALPGKYLRPWEIDPDIYTSLDRNQAWWGFEFETGYVSEEARAEVIDYCWDNFTNVCFDTEGEGEWAVEITFAPEEKSKYESGEAQAIKFVQYLTNNPLVNNTKAANVGTHINLSSPKLTAGNMEWAAWGLSRSVAALPVQMQNKANTREYMFGRQQLYGGFFEQSVNGSVWIEGKVFRTTYDIEQFKRYLKVCDGLTRCLDTLCDALGPKFVSTKNIPYVTNLYEVCFEDASPVVERADYERMDGVRNGNAINGPFARDVLAGVVASPIEVEDDDDYDDDDWDLDDEDWDPDYGDAA